jgi:hypothetical protein
MIPEFIAWDPDGEEGGKWISPDYIDRDGLAWWKSNSIPTCTDKVYPYIGRKDKDGKKVYAGSRVSFLFKEGHRYSGHRYSGIVEYDARDSSYIIAFNRCSSCRAGQAKDIKVVGHIAEDGCGVVKHAQVRVLHSPPK